MNNYANIIDIGGNAFYFVYMIVRSANPEYELPLNNIIYNINQQYQKQNEFVPTDSDHVVMKISVWIMLLQLILMIFSFLKIHILWKHSERFAMLVQLLQTCITEVYSFMAFFFVWTVSFSIQYQILGMEIDEGDFGGVNIYLVYFIQTI